MIGRKIFPQEESFYVYLLNSSNIKTLVNGYLGKGVESVDKAVKLKLPNR